MVRTPPLIARRGFQLVTLAFAMALAGYVRTAVSPLQEAMRVALSLSDNHMAVLQGPIIGIPVVLASIPLGVLIDRHTRVRLLMALVVLSIAGSLLTAAASNFGVLLLGRCLAGTTGLAILPVVFSLLADLYPPAQRGFAITVAIIGQVAGNSAAFALGGEFMAMSDAGAAGWRWAMYALVVPMIPVLLMMLALREPTRAEVQIRSPSASQVWRELQRYRGQIAPLAIGIVLAEVAIGAIIIWAAPMLSRRYGLPPDQIGAIMGTGMLISGILGPCLGGPLADLCQRTGGPRRTVVVLFVLALLSVPAGLFAFVPGAALASVLLIFSMTVLLALVVMGMALFTLAIPNEIRGLCMSMLVAAEILFALAVGPPAVSLVSGALGGPEMIGKALSIVCVAAGALGAVSFLLGWRNFPRERTPVEDSSLLSECRE